MYTYYEIKWATSLFYYNDKMYLNIPSLHLNNKIKQTQCSNEEELNCDSSKLTERSRGVAQ